MKVLVTGADGQLGSDLCRLLETRGDEVIAPTLADMDFLQPDSIGKQVRAHQPDWLINCAAYTQVDLAEQEADKAFTINRDAAEAVTRATLEQGCRLLHVSTDFIFDGRQTAPYEEQAAGNPLSVYGDSKWQGEQAVLRHDPQALVLRTAWVYGVHGENFVKTMLRLAGDREELRVVADQRGTPSWTRDIAGAMLALMDQQATGVFHYTNEGEATWYEFACAIVDEAREAGFKLKVERMTPISTAEYPTAATRPAYSVLDKTRIKALLKQPIPHWRDSLRAMIKELAVCPDYL